MRHPSLATLLTLALVLPGLAACGGGGSGGGTPTGDGGGGDAPPDFSLIPPGPVTITYLVGFGALRSFDGGATVFPLAFASVSPGTEDRTIAHFDVRNVPAFSKAYIHIPMDNIDEGGAPGTFDVHRFFGDGVVSADEWNDGTLTDQFPGIQGDRVLTINATSYIQHCQSNGFPFLSLNLRAGTGTDRYNLGSMAGLDLPWIELVP